MKDRRFLGLKWFPGMIGTSLSILVSGVVGILYGNVELYAGSSRWKGFDTGKLVEREIASLPE